MGKPKDEEYIKLEKAAPLVYEISGVSRCRSALAKWARYGRRSAVGKKVRLKTSKRLGLIYTTRKWLEEFIRAVG